MKVKRRQFESNGKPTGKKRKHQKVENMAKKVGWNAIKQGKPQQKYTITKAKKERKKKTTTKKTTINRNVWKCAREPHTEEIFYPRSMSKYKKASNFAVRSISIWNVYCFYPHSNGTSSMKIDIKSTETDQYGSVKSRQAN